MKASLSPKQARFVAEYLVSLNATQAAIKAGYSPRTAKSIGQENLTKPDIASAIQAGQAKKLDTLEFDAQRVIQELGRLAFTDIRGFFDEHGNLKPMHELTAAQGSAIAGFEVIIKNAVAGDGVTDRIHKFKLWDKVKALDILAKHFGLMPKEKADVDVRVGVQVVYSPLMQPDGMGNG